MKSKGKTRGICSVVLVVFSLKTEVFAFWRSNIAFISKTRLKHCCKTPVTAIHVISPSNLNEFSRRVDPERIRSRRDYALEIIATEVECQALASRFDLPDIQSLTAVLLLRPDGSRSDGVQVEGNITATITRACVRTGEYFVLPGMEVPLYSVVRPVTPIATVMSMEKAAFTNSPKTTGGGKAKQRKATYKPPDRNLDDMDIMQLQRLLQTDFSSEDDDVLMQDEAIYATDGMIDVGELVAQLFWLSLDRYPKKPGTDPVRASISG
jgi:hypothetical protein